MSSLAEGLWAWRVQFRVDVLATGMHPLLEGQQPTLPHLFVVPPRVAQVSVRVGGQALSPSGGEAFVVTRPSAFPVEVVSVIGVAVELNGNRHGDPWCPAHPGGVLVRLVPRETVPETLFAACPAVAPSSTSDVRVLSGLIADEVARLPDLCSTSIAHLGNLLLLKVLGPLQDSACPVASAGPVSAEVSRAVQLMRNDLARRWTVASLAEEVGMSRSAFASLFSDVVGKPPMTVLLEYRMQRAGDLLAGSRASIKEIAAEVGYRSSATFSMVFRKWSGQTPTEFRRSRS